MRSAVKVIEANHVYKVFGRRPSDGVKKLKAGRTRDQLRKSGQTAAVIDTSFDVDKGEIFVVMGSPPSSAWSTACCPSRPAA